MQTGRMPKNRRTQDFGMPKRPRSHRLEDQSRVAFSNLLSENWIESPRVKDYGIDSDVEMFSGDDATGIRFSVQLKATDSARPPGVSVREESLNYWLSQDVPVLLVFWRSVDSQVWFRWAHLIDPTPILEGRKSVRVAFGEGDQWFEGAAEESEKEVRAFRSIRNRTVSLPISVGVFGSGSVGKVAAGDVVKVLREELRESRGVFDLRPQGASISINIQISEDEVRVALRGASPKFIHYGTAPPVESSAEYLDRVDGFASDALFGVAQQLNHVGFLGEAAAIARRASTRSSIMRGDALPIALRVLISGGEKSTAIELLRNSREPGSESSLPDLMAAMLERPGDSTGEDPVVDLLLSWADEDLSVNTPKTAAPLVYNAGHRVIGSDPERAVVLLRKAAEIDPGYEERPYWRSDLAGAQFLAGHYEESAISYLEAVGRGDSSVGLRCGDALMFAGRFEEALHFLLETDRRVEHAEYRIKARYLSRLIKDFSVKSQARDPFVAERMSEDAEFSSSLARSVLNVDLLYPAALWGMAFTVGSEADPDIDYLLAATFSDPGNARAWFAILGYLDAIGDEDLQSDVLYCARRFAGEEVLDLAWDEAPELAEVLQRIFSAMPSEDPGPRVTRAVIFGSGEYSEYEHG